MAYQVKSKLQVDNQQYIIYSLKKLEEQGLTTIARLPFSIRVLLENVLRKLDGRIVSEDDVKALANWQPRYDQPREIPYHPARVLMQDFTGVPAMVDLAAMRDAMRELGQDPRKINPLVPVDLVIDHSIQVDFFGSADALTKNVAREYQRNQERYTLLKWSQRAFDNVRIFPTNVGICHQINLEYIGQVVMNAEVNGILEAFPDTLVGTDSHTTMINGLGVLGWGVGGIEAEAVMLGQPYYMPIPEVIGVKLTGQLPQGTTATDLVLRVTELLRQHNVVEKFVEYFGPGIKNLTLPDRATISNMAPEYGATMGFFPVDEETLRYLRFTNRGASANLVEKYTQVQGLFFYGYETPEYSQIIELDMTTLTPALAGPKRPQDRIEVAAMATRFAEFIHQEKIASKRTFPIQLNGEEVAISDGSVVIAAITSCTNTSNPVLMLGAGLVAKKAVEKGLQRQPYVKTSFAPGSMVVAGYMQQAGLMPYLEALGFHIAAFGCTTCIGNSGPLAPEIEACIKENQLLATAVLSGNRNFEARIHALVRGNYLASPMLVVAYAIAGRVDIDLTSEPLATGKDGQPVYLRDIWPHQEQIRQLIATVLKPEMFAEKYCNILAGDDNWQKLNAPDGDTFQWAADSTYIRRPPFFENFTREVPALADIHQARPLLLLGDSITTDHISPAGAIAVDYPAGSYLRQHGVAISEFNSYGSRRGNHEVMMRGTFANVRIKNQLVTPQEGGWSQKMPENTLGYVYDVAGQYQQARVPLLVLGGKEYGSGSSRDWAAKGTMLLGVKAVIAQSFERIHRSNLVGMGVLPLVFQEGYSWEKLGLDGSETYDIAGVTTITPGNKLEVRATKADGSIVAFTVLARLDTSIDVDYFRHGGILPLVLRKLAQ